jgi:hypothetical protein
MSGLMTLLYASASFTFNTKPMRLALLSATILLPILIFSQKKTVSIRIEQDTTIHVLAGTIDTPVILKKEPFKIVVSLKNLEGVYLFADFTDSIYKLKDNEKIPDFENLPSMAMAEATFNEDQELIISKDGWAFWFYDKKENWHRFDKTITVTGDSVTGTKTIKQFYIPEPKNNLPVEEVKDTLYLFFVAIDKTNKKGMPEKELIRLKARIVWE